MPVLFAASVMKDGATCLRFDVASVEIKIVNGVAQLDMCRQDIEYLRDVCIAATQAAQ